MKIVLHFVVNKEEYPVIARYRNVYGKMMTIEVPPGMQATIPSRSRRPPQVSKKKEDDFFPTDNLSWT